MGAMESPPSPEGSPRDRTAFVEPRGSSMRAYRIVVSVLSSLILLTVAAPPVQASPRGTPLTCGMVISRDAQLYLAHDLTCPDFAVRVEQDHSGDVPPPNVRIDLRGHTLRGPGTADGIVAFSGGSDVTHVEVVNGRLKNWDTAVGGDYEVRTRNVALVGNNIGFACGGFGCSADRTHFQDNAEGGFFVYADASGRVTRSTFVRNAVGARVIFISGLTIDHSIFIRNDVGVLADDAQVTVSRSLFVRNATAVKVIPYDNDWPCANLQRDRFIRNGVNLDGPRCAA